MWVVKEPSCRFPRVVVRLVFCQNCDWHRGGHCQSTASPFQLILCLPTAPLLTPPPGTRGGRRHTLGPENSGGSLQWTSEKDILYQPSPARLCAVPFPKIDQPCPVLRSQRLRRPLSTQRNRSEPNKRPAASPLSFPPSSLPLPVSGTLCSRLAAIHP